MALVRYGKTLIPHRILHNSRRFQHGYIVLLPEIGEGSETNPLYLSDGLPKFNEVTIENCRAAIAKQTLALEMGIQEIENNIADNPIDYVFEQIIEPIELLGNPMEATWGVSKTLYMGNNTLMPTSSYMAIHDRARRARAAKYTSKKIYCAIKENFSKEKQRTVEETRILQKFILEGKLNGLELDTNNYDALEYNFAKLTQEKSNFKFKNDISLKQHSQLIEDSSIVRDFPEDLLKPFLEPFEFTLYLPMHFEMYFYVWEWRKLRQRSFLLLNL